MPINEEETLCEWASSLADSTLAGFLTRLAVEIRTWTPKERSALLNEAANRIQNKTPDGME